MFRELTKARHRLIPVLTGNSVIMRFIVRLATVNPRTYGEQSFDEAVAQWDSG